MDPTYEEAYARIEERHPWFVARRELFHDFLSGAEERRILDIGCGTGMFLVHLRERGFARLAGVEPSSNLRSKFRDPAIPVHADIPPEEFDVISMLDVLEHIEDDEGMLGKVFEALAPDGLFYASVPAHPFLWSTHDEENHHHRRYRRRELSEKVRRAGFQIERLTYWNCFAFPPICLVRILRRRSKKGAETTEARRSDLELGNSLTRGVYRRLLSLENVLVKRTGLPIGVSLILIARRTR